MTVISGDRRSGVFRRLNFLLEVSHHLLNVGRFCGPSDIGQQKLRSMWCSHLSGACHCYLFSRSGRPVFLREPLDDCRQNCRQSFLKTFPFFSVRVLKWGPGQDWKSDSVILDKMMTICSDTEPVKNQCSEKKSKFFRPREGPHFSKTSRLKNHRPEKTKMSACTM